MIPSRLPTTKTSACFFLLILTASAMMASTCFADRLYVAKNGNNGRSRAQARNRSTPWRTIQYAVNQARPGDSIVVRSGVYYERVRIFRRGQRGNEIELRTEVQEGARVIGGISAVGQAFISINGFDISNFSRTGETKGISFVRCHHVTVRNCRVRDCWGGGIGFDQSDWILCQWNIVHGNAFFNPAQHSGISVFQPQYRSSDSRRFGIVIQNNTSFNNRNLVNNADFGRPTDGNGIVVDDFFNGQQGGNGVAYDRQTLIENNLCFDNGGQGIHCFRSQNIRIRNNTCSNNLSSFDFGGEVSVSESRRVYVYNNIFVSSPGKFAAFQFDSTNISFFFNLFDGPTRSVEFNGSNISGDPGFVPGTFELAPFSRAVDAGLDAGQRFFLDVYGRNRVVGRTDMGAAESQ